MPCEDDKYLKKEEMPMKSVWFQTRKQHKWSFNTLKISLYQNLKDTFE